MRMSTLCAQTDRAGQGRAGQGINPFLKMHREIKRVSWKVRLGTLKLTFLKYSRSTVVIRAQLWSTPYKVTSFFRDASGCAGWLAHDGPETLHTDEPSYAHAMPTIISV